MRASDVTAVILTRDEERNLPRALTSLPHGIQVLVVDSFSDDRTVEYARAAGAQVIERTWEGFMEARRFALAQVQTPWTLVIDADEALDDRLRDALVAAAGDVDGYIVRRTTYFRGKPMRMWMNEPLLRLMRTGRARVESRPATGGAAHVHEYFVCDGTAGELNGTLLHYSYPDAASYRLKFARYTSLEARGLRPSVPAAAVATLSAPVRFADNLLRRRAIVDGPRGWYIAWCSAWYPAVARWKSLG
jgi:glycosyltransferase involved in cell wall biosynthesis